jgi:transposase
MGKSITELSSVTRVGLDLAKKVFRVHAVDARGAVVVGRSINRRTLLKFFDALPRCLVAMEACASAHHWARQLIGLGFEVKLIPPAHVKPYVRRNKNDAADAAAICEAAGRPSQRFVPVRSVANQAELMRHRARELLVGQRTAALNALRGHFGEMGIVVAQGPQNAYRLKRMVTDGCDENGEILLPDGVRQALEPLARHIDALDEAIAAIDKELEASARTDATARRLMTIPGVGPVTASAIVATVQDAGAFASGRDFAAFLGLTPRERSTGGKERLGRITKMGDRYLRKLLVVGACATLSHRKGHNDALRLWASGLLERKTVKYKFKLTAVALANKIARIVYALLTKGGQYDGRPAAA